MLLLRGLTTRLGHITYTAEQLAEQYSGGRDDPTRATGITCLHHFAHEDDLVAIGSETVHQALDRAGVTREDVGALVATSNFCHPTLMPTLGPALAARAGFHRIRTATIGTGCGGIAQAFEHAAGLLTSPLLGFPEDKHVVIVAAEHFSRRIDPEDIKTRYLFSDGVGALVLMKSTPEPGDLVLAQVASRSLIVPHTLNGLRVHNPLFYPDPFFRMQTGPVTRFTRAVMSQALELLGRDSWTGLSIIPHQANARLLARMQAQAPGAASFYHAGIGRIGNTLNASTLFALEDARARDLLGSDHIVLVPFGAEWTIGIVQLNAYRID